MALRSSVYIVPTDRWYIERTVGLIAGFVLLASAGMALLLDRRWILGVIGTGLVSINVCFTGFCPAGNVLRLFGSTFRLHRFWYWCIARGGLYSRCLWAARPTFQRPRPWRSSNHPHFPTQKESR